MTTATATTDKAVEFRAEHFIGNARLYVEHKRLVDAASKYDNVDDATNALMDVWAALDNQSKIGGGYTPPVEAGFGSDNGSQIAATILGRKSSVNETRKAFAALGKGVVAGR